MSTNPPSEPLSAEYSERASYLLARFHLHLACCAFALHSITSSPPTLRSSKHPSRQLGHPVYGMVGIVPGLLNLEFRHGGFGVEGVITIRNGTVRGIFCVVFRDEEVIDTGQLLRSRAVIVLPGALALALAWIGIMGGSDLGDAVVVALGYLRRRWRTASSYSRPLVDYPWPSPSSRNLSCSWSLVSTIWDSCLCALASFDDSLVALLNCEPFVRARRRWRRGSLAVEQEIVVAGPRSRIVSCHAVTRRLPFRFCMRPSSSHVVVCSFSARLGNVLGRGCARRRSASLGSALSTCGGTLHLRFCCGAV